MEAQSLLACKMCRTHMRHFATFCHFCEITNSFCHKSEVCHNVVDTKPCFRYNESITWSHLDLSNVSCALLGLVLSQDSCVTLCQLASTASLARALITLPTRLIIQRFSSTRKRRFRGKCRIGKNERRKFS